ncbi:MAG: LPS export ABC transporter permease LptF [Alphaproteobacteria bacterium]|nr:LPS export ABC transporter permease LptF [Alphaproteobacteria bacterium]
MYRYSKYITGQLGGATLFVASGLTCVIWLTQSLRFVDLIVNSGLDMLAFIYLTTMMLPSLLGFMLPIALAISTLYTYHKLLADSELVVLKSAGLSRWQLAKPAVMFAIGIVVLGYVISLYLLPVSYRQYKDMQAFARDNYAALLLQEGVFNNPVPGLTVFIRERNDDGTLRGILVHDNRDPDAPVTMMAEEGQLVKTPRGPSFILKNGNRQEIDHQEEQLSFLGFDDYVLDISLFTKTGNKRVRDEKERYLGELLNPEENATPVQRAEFRAEAHQRLTWPLQNMALTLFVMSMLLAGQFNRRGNWRRYTITLVSVGMLLAAVVAISNIVVKHPNLIVFMYLLPVGVSLASLYAIMRSPLEKLIPTEPPSAMMAEEGK